jgi:hypothetical protein
MTARVHWVDKVIFHIRRHGSNTAVATFGPGLIRFLQKHLKTIDAHAGFVRGERRSFRGRCMFHLGNARYAQKHWLSPVWWYLRGACSRPAFLGESEFWGQLAKSMLPPVAREWLQGWLRAEPPGKRPGQA